VNGTITIDFGTMPLGMLSAGSLTTDGRIGTFRGIGAWDHFFV